MKFNLTKKIWEMSKFFIYVAILQTLFISTAVAYNADAQGLKETLIQSNWNKVELEQAFRHIQLQTDYSFTFDRAEIENIKLSSESEEMSLADFLYFISGKTGLSFSVYKKYIYVFEGDREMDDQERITIPELDILSEALVDLQHSVVYQISTKDLPYDQVVNGKVSNEEGTPLVGATVVVKETGMGTVTDADGTFSLAIPDEGGATLVVSYVGYEAKEIDVNGQAQVNVSLEVSATALNEIVVKSFKGQNLNAIASKRLNLQIADFLSQDNIGRLPDFAVADAARRIAGVHTVFQEDEATLVSVRGLPPIFTFSTIDGMYLPSMSRGSRVTNFETIPSSAVATVEVFKSRTPDQDANAIGGTFNLRTRSAFDKEDFFVTGRATVGKYNFDEIPRSELFRNKVDQNGLSVRSDLTISKRFFKNKTLGLVLSGSYNRKDRDELKVPKRNYNFLNNDPNLPVPDRFYGTTYDNLIERYGGFGKLEFKPNRNFYAGVSANFYKKTDDEVRMENRFRNLAYDENSVTMEGGSFNGGRVQLAYDYFLIEHRMTNVVFDTYYKMGKSKIDGKLGYAEGYLGQDGPWGGFDFAFDEALSGTYTIGTDIDDFTLNFDNPDVYTNPANWDSHYIGGRAYRDNEAALAGQLNYAFNMGNSADGFGFKTGISYRDVEHQFDRIDMSVNYDNSLPLTFADFPLQSYTHPFFNNGEVGLIHFDTHAFENWVAENTNLEGLNNDFGTILNRAGRYNLSNRFIIDETVFAAYLMGRLRLNNLSLVGGFRFEDTQTDLTRIPEINGERNENVTLTQQNDYTNFLPTLNAILDLTPQIRIKAGYNQSIGRGDYQQIAPVAFVDDANERRSEGNPDLRPRKADNFDLNLEYYFDDGSSLFSFGIFHKNVVDDIQSNEFVDPTNGYLVTTNFNTLGFDVTGFEVNLIKSDFEDILPGFLSNMGVSTNFTFVSGRREITSDQYVTSIANMPRTILNTQLFYQTDKFDTRLAFNHVGRHVRHARDNDPSNPINDDTYWKAFSQFDFAFNYYLNKNYSVFFEARNFTNADRGYLRGTNLLIEDVIFGGSLWLGVNFNIN